MNLFVLRFTCGIRWATAWYGPWKCRIKLNRPPSILPELGSPSVSSGQRNSFLMCLSNVCLTVCTVSGSVVSNVLCQSVFSFSICHMMSLSILICLSVLLFLSMSIFFRSCLSVCLFVLYPSVCICLSASYGIAPVHRDIACGTKIIPARTCSYLHWFICKYLHWFILYAVGNGWSWTLLRTRLWVVKWTEMSNWMPSHSPRMETSSQSAVTTTTFISTRYFFIYCSSSLQFLW